MSMVSTSTAFLIENGSWCLLTDIVPSSKVDTLRLKNDLLKIGKKLRNSLGLRFDPFDFRTGVSGIEVSVSGIAGTISTGDTVLEIAPKFVPQGMISADWDASLLLLMQYAKKRHIAYNRSKYLSASRHNFVDLMAIAFLDSVEAGLSDQMIHTYQTREERLPIMRGRLNLQRQIKSVFVRPHLLECDVNQLDAVNPFNGLLKWAAQALTASVRSSSIRRRVSDISQLFPGRPDRSIAMRGMQVNPPPQFRTWTGALEIASMLSAGLSHTASRGSQNGYSFVFNMEKLFEHFVQCSLQRAVSRVEKLKLTVNAQVQTAYAMPTSDGKVVFYSKPDNVVKNVDKAVAIVDAKYKRLSDQSGAKNKKPVNQDVYELVAAMTAQRCRVGLLVYPKVHGDAELSDGDLQVWTVDAFGTTLHVGAVAIDLVGLHSLNDLQKVDQKLASVLQDILSQAEVSQS